MRRAAATLATAVVGALALAGAAHAEHIGRPSQAACRTSAHFVIHCDAGTVTGTYLDAAVEDFEEAYSRDVAGAGGDPNAGLAAPVDDGDARTDVYIRIPPGHPDFSGGIVFRDPYHVAGRGQAAYVFLTPDLSLGAFRFRAAHEFMHVLLRGYFGMYGPTFEEGFANWAAENALPDVDPGDSNFSFPWLPLDCTTPECGQGYWQWLFFQRQTEDFGVGFVEALLRRAASSPSFSGNFMLPALRDELAARTGRPAEEALRVRFADYARKVWDPAAWRTSAVQALHERSGPPAVDPELGLYVGFPATGPRSAAVDHLAARYAELHLNETNPDDDLRVTILPPPGLLATPDILFGPSSGPRADLPLAPDGSGAYSAIIKGVDWVTKNAVKPAVANMSLGGTTSKTLNDAVKKSIAAGITYAVAAGNDNKDACQQSPASQPDAITVAATDSTDTRASFSNFGTCVDLFAPGVRITAASSKSDTGTTIMSGTSMASPHVAGAAALVLGANPAFTPKQVRDTLVAKASANRVYDLAGSPSALLNTGWLNGVTTSGTAKR